MYSVQTGYIREQISETNFTTFIVSERNVYNTVDPEGL